MLIIALVCAIMSIYVWHSDNEKPIATLLLSGILLIFALVCVLYWAKGIYI
jgi:hypothetical protein